jgi:hypothetical protein
VDLRRWNADAVAGILGGRVFDSHLLQAQLQWVHLHREGAALARGRDRRPRHSAGQTRSRSTHGEREADIIQLPCHQVEFRWRLTNEHAAHQRTCNANRHAISASDLSRSRPGRWLLTLHPNQCIREIETDELRPAMHIHVEHIYVEHIHVGMSRVFMSGVVAGWQSYPWLFVIC